MDDGRQRAREQLGDRWTRSVMERLAGGPRLGEAELTLLERAVREGIDGAVAECSAARSAAFLLAEARLQALADRAPAPVFLKDATGRYTFVNAGFSALVGRPKEEILGRTNRELFPAAQAAHLDEAERRVLAGETLEAEEEVTRSGRTQVYATVKFPVPEGGGLGCVSLEITARKRAEDEARHAAELLELGDAFFELDRGWRIVRVNANQERLSRKPRAETVGRRFDEVWPELCADPPSRYLVEYRRAMDERVPREFDDYYAPLDLWTAVTAYPVSGGGIAVFFRDVTERKRVEREREQAREFERQLLGIVSHDLRSPLSAIALGAHALLARGGLDERQATTVGRIRSSAERATRLIHDLLDFAQVRMGGRMELRCRPTDLAACARQAIDEARETFTDRQVSLRIDGDARGEWDPDRLVQVATNLVTNALKYGSPAEPVTVIVDGDGDATLAVHNFGASIDPAELPRLFEPLQRGPADPGREESQPRSVGLGLFIVKTIVEAHGGNVSVESAPRAGTTFRVRLPRTGSCGEIEERRAG